MLGHQRHASEGRWPEDSGNLFLTPSPKKTKKTLLIKLEICTFSYGRSNVLEKKLLKRAAPDVLNGN